MAKREQKNRVCDLLDSLLGVAVDYLKLFWVNQSLQVFDVKENSVMLGMHSNYELYGLKLTSPDNRLFGYQGIASFVREMRQTPGADMYIYIVKQKRHMAIYVFSYKRELISRMSSDMNLPMMTGNELVRALFDLFRANEYRIEDNREITTISEDIQGFLPYGLEMSSGGVEKRVQLASDKLMRDYTLYQGVGYAESNDFDPKKLLSMRWEGIFGMYVGMQTSSVKNRIAAYHSVARLSENKEYAKRCADIAEGKDEDGIRELSELACVVNSFLLLESPDSLGTIEGALAIEFRENYLTGPKIVPKTLLLARDNTFDTVVSMATATKLLQSTLRHEVPAEFAADFHGYDINGAFLNYSLSMSINPHVLMTGNTGSGKSVQWLKIFRHMLGHDMQTGKCKNLGKIVRAKYCDVGYTSGRLAASIKGAHPKQTEIMKSNVEELRFALFDFDLDSARNVEQVDMDFVVGFLNFALEAKGSDIMTAIEEAIFSEVTRALVKDRVYDNLWVSELISKGGFDFLVDELREKGIYHDNMRISDLPAEYDHFRRPVLANVIGAIKSRASRPDLDEVRRSSHLRLVDKLEALATYELFSSHSNVHFADTIDFHHIDFDAIKENAPKFGVIFWMLFRKWMRSLKKDALPRIERQETPIPTYIIVEEAHNFFKYPAFKDLLKTAAREVRKFGGRLVFITQQISDVPDDVLSEMATRIMVFPPNKKDALIDEVESAFSELGEADREVIDGIENRMMLIMSDQGTMSCKIDHDKETEWFYKPYIAS